MFKLEEMFVHEVVIAQIKEQLDAELVSVKICLVTGDVFG